MNPVRRTLLAATLTLLTPQLAGACAVNKPLSQLDIAFADVIFEGSLTGVDLVRRDQSEDRPAFFELTFDVDEVVRGELQQDEVVVGWTTAHYKDTWDRSFEYFKNSFGETSRVGISTPELAESFCEVKAVTESAYDKGTGAIISGERRKPVCGVTVDSIELAARVNIPFVLSNNYTCGGSYIFPVEMYEDMRNHEKNVAAYQKVRETYRSNRDSGDRNVDYVKLYREMVPQSSVPWKYYDITASNLAIDLAAIHPWFFGPALKTDTALQATLLDLGVAIGRYKTGRRTVWFDRDENELAKFREDLNEEMLRLVDYMEKDPNFRDRLLLED